MCESLQSAEEQLPDNALANTLSENKNVVCVPAAANLLDLPVEIVLKILSLLDAKFLKDTVRKVCKRFDDILADDSLWKYWVFSKIHGSYPALPNLKIYDDTPIDWEEVCVELDVEQKKWSKASQNLRHLVIKDCHYASVDAVLLINGGEMCVSGGRDRGLAVWNIMDFKDPENTYVNPPPSLINTSPENMMNDAHAGWIWDLTTEDLENTSIIYSASWDNTVKAWDINTGLTCIETFRCGMSALSVVSCDKIVMAGLYSNKILAFDLRSGPSPINWYKVHKGPVLSLTSYNNMVASVSEDKTLAIWDRNAGKIMKSNIKIPCDKAYPVCVSWQAGALYIGDSKGGLHLFNPEDHSFVKTHEIWKESSVTEPQNKIAGCHQSDGSIIVCSDRGQIKFLCNANPPEQYGEIQTRTFEVTQLRYLNGILVTATCDSALEFWIPRERYVDL